jgi:hypothetical protein
VLERQQQQQEIEQRRTAHPKRHHPVPPTRSAWGYAPPVVVGSEWDGQTPPRSTHFRTSDRALTRQVDEPTFGRSRTWHWMIHTPVRADFSDLLTHCLVQHRLSCFSRSFASG